MKKSVISKIKYTRLCLDNIKYNELVANGFNMNKIKAYMHNQALSLLIKKNNLNNPRLIVDQFAEKDLYYSYLKDVKEVVRNIEFITKAESSSPAVAAASIIAKVTRDRLMEEYDRQYPEYGFGSHKGYGTAEHIAAVEKYGPCPIHRMTFEPIRTIKAKWQCR